MNCQGLNSFSKRLCSTQLRLNKKPKDSIVERFYEFSTNLDLRYDYTNIFGDMRIGLLFQDMDDLAGSVAYKHALGEKLSVVGGRSQGDTRGLVIVTAGVDYIRLYSPIYTLKDLKIEGKVTHVGRSSMEVLITADMLDTVPKRVIEANYTMVARDETNNAKEVPDLTPESEEDEYLNDRAIQNRARRQYSLLTSLEHHPPTNGELFFIHKLFLDQKKFGIKEGHTPISTSFHKSLFLMHPQKRNIHGKVFGGYLMRLAFEQAWSNVYLFTGSRPKFIASDDINFLSPVHLGAICTFKSTITYSRINEKDKTELVVEVVADVVDPQTQTENTTNTFIFVFSCHKSFKQVVPVTYNEAMKYLDGKRRLDRLLKAD